MTFVHLIYVLAQYIVVIFYLMASLFFRLKPMKEEWVPLVGQAMKDCKSCSPKICTDHFTLDQFQEGTSRKTEKGQRILLVPGAVPVSIKKGKRGNYSPIMILNPVNLVWPCLCYHCLYFTRFFFSKKR